MKFRVKETELISSVSLLQKSKRDVGKNMMEEFQKRNIQEKEIRNILEIKKQNKTKNE